MEEEAVEIFEIGKIITIIKTELSYTNKLLIKLYLLWKLSILDMPFFLFANTTSHFVYARDTLQVKDINGSNGEKQPILRNSCLKKKGLELRNV